MFTTGLILGAFLGAVIVVSSKAAYAWVAKQRAAAIAKVDPPKA